ncbi:hypothetical protein JKP88DRAFT_319400 [Tribonema minus]|uniref:Uncharacterized protein n=1 Tax=Tribonema minus TaxID=303371 RepID=A0A836CDY5_9STRA|nr:hypothetical protein JKP88DRAFT_319400 [Tribonema minus]
MDRLTFMIDLDGKRIPLRLPGTVDLIDLETLTQKALGACNKATSSRRRLAVRDEDGGLTFLHQVFLEDLLVESAVASAARPRQCIRLILDLPPGHEAPPAPSPPARRALPGRGTYDDIIVKLQAAHESVYGRSDWEPAKQAVVALISFFHAQIFMLPDDALMDRYNHMCHAAHEYEGTSGSAEGSHSQRAILDWRKCSVRTYFMSCFVRSTAACR